MVQHPNQITAEVASLTRPAFAAIGGHRSTGSALTQPYGPAHDDGTAVGPSATCS